MFTRKEIQTAPPEMLTLEGIEFSLTSDLARIRQDFLSAADAVQSTLDEIGKCQQWKLSQGGNPAQDQRMEQLEERLPSLEKEREFARRAWVFAQTEARKAAIRGKAEELAAMRPDLAQAIAGIDSAMLVVTERIRATQPALDAFRQLRAQLTQAGVHDAAGNVYIPRDKYVNAIRSAIPQTLND